MDNQNFAGQLRKIWKQEDSKNKAWLKVADYVLDNYVSKEVLKEFVSHDKLREWLDVCMPLQDMDKRVALFKYEISRLKGIEKQWNEKNDTSWQYKAMDYLDKKSQEELKKNIEEFAEIVDKPKFIDTIIIDDSLVPTRYTIALNKTIQAVNYLLERANELMQFDLTTEIGRKEYDHFMKQRSK